MSAAALLAELRSAGVTISTDGDRLRFRGPAEARTPERDAALREHKSALLALLAEETAKGDAARIEAARRIFDAEPMPDAVTPGIKRCRACNTERHVGGGACPVCHPLGSPPRTGAVSAGSSRDAVASAPDSRSDTTLPAANPDPWDTARAITHLSPDELAQYEADLAQAPGDDPHVDHDRAALRLAKSMLAGGVAARTAA